jgi:hypothetical protein
MNPRTVTVYLILLSVAIIPALWITWDVIACRKGGQQATETETIRRWSRAHMLVPWAVGFVMGALVMHFWGAPL